jgi:hypothetical protein
LTILCIRLWPKGIETLIKRPRGARGIYYIIAIIISGIITTPDIISQMVVTIPIILLYEVTIYIICIFMREVSDIDIHVRGSGHLALIPTKGTQGNEENR